MGSTTSQQSTVLTHNDEANTRAKRSRVERLVMHLEQKMTEKTCKNCKFFEQYDNQCKVNFGVVYGDDSCLLFEEEYKFQKTYCSQCGSEFGKGNEGFSHCNDHQNL